MYIHALLCPIICFHIYMFSIQIYICAYVYTCIICPIICFHIYKYISVLMYIHALYVQLYVFIYINIYLCLCIYMHYMSNYMFSYI